MSNEDIKINEKRKYSFSLLLRYAFQRCYSSLGIATVCLLTYYVTVVILITIIMALVIIQSAREQFQNINQFTIFPFYKILSASEEYYSKGRAPRL